MPSTCHLTLTTAPTPGAIAILQLAGPNTRRILTLLTGGANWSPHRLVRADFAGIDQGLAVYLPPTATASHPPVPCAQLLPHGGPRVVQKLIAKLGDLGAAYEPDPPARQLYPEAASDLQADMLATLARAASPAAMDLLLAQPRLWRAALTHPATARTARLAQTRHLDRLVTPASVVVIGRPNVGKSTLANRMLGRTASIVADLPGTTRDWVAGWAELPVASTSETSADEIPGGGICVRWYDTPGLHHSADPLEQHAITLAQNIITSADVLIALRDPQIPWPDPAALPRTPDLWVCNKIDTPAPGTAPGIKSKIQNPKSKISSAPGIAPEAHGVTPWASALTSHSTNPQSPLPVSAQTGAGLDQLAHAILQHLGLTDLTPRLWAFSPRLHAWRSPADSADLRPYAGL